MSNKVDQTNGVIVGVYGAVTGGIMSYGEEFFVTIILATTGAIVSTVVSHLVKRYLRDK